MDTGGNADFRIIDEIRRAIPDYPPEEVERDIAEAIAAARAEAHAIDVYAGKMGSVEEVFGQFRGRVIVPESPEAPTLDDWEGNT